jgi:hypothetical protein
MKPKINTIQTRKPCLQCCHEIVPEDDRCNCVEVSLRDEIKRLKNNVELLADRLICASETMARFTLEKEITDMNKTTYTGGQHDHQA